ncbi:MAG: hypothetical protein LBJ91_00985 [Clostridiales Family XIII bacterium]|jgi:hypothetical protein|nr:hypothetical protein [Clostridiales Family XIII bacterium]
MSKLIYGRSIAQRRILAVVLAIALALSLGMAFGAQSQTYAADPNQSYDLLYSAQDDAAGLQNYSYTVPYDSDEPEYTYFEIVGGDSSTGARVALTEVDAEDIVYSFNTPGADDYITIFDSEVTEWGDGYEYLPYIEIAPSTPVGPYSIHFEIDSSPTIYADFTIVVNDPSSPSDPISGVNIAYYEGAITTTNPAITAGALAVVPYNAYEPPDAFAADDRSYPTAMDAVGQSQAQQIIEMYNGNRALVIQPILYNVEYDSVWYPTEVDEEGWLYAVYKSNGDGTYTRDTLSKVIGPFDYQLEKSDLVTWVLVDKDDYADYDDFFPNTLPV